MNFMQGSHLFRDSETPVTDERQAALRYLRDAWEEAVFHGVDPDNLATAAIFAARDASYEPACE